MDRGINASFIPKGDIKSKQKKARAPLAANLFLLIAIIVFLTSLLASLGVYLWLQQLESANSAALQQLNDNRDNFGLSTVEEFINVNNRIKAASFILDNHVNISEVFDILEENTLSEVYLADFSFATDGPEVVVSSRGFAPTYAHVALQADQYGRDGSQMKDLLLTGVNQAREGGIQFDLSFALDKDLFITNL